jgi:hypothetical protein
MHSVVDYNEFPRKLFASIDLRKRETIFLHPNVWLFENTERFQMVTQILVTFIYKQYAF